MSRSLAKAMCQRAIVEVSSGAHRGSSISRDGSSRVFGVNTFAHHRSAGFQQSRHILAFVRDECATPSRRGRSRSMLAHRCAWRRRDVCSLEVVAGVGEVEAFVGEGEVGDDRVGEGDGQGGPVEE